MRILIIEDNIATANYLSQGFKENFFIPDVAHNGQDGLFMALTNAYDAIVLDVMLPHMDGWQLVQAFRQKNTVTPVLFLTAKDAVNDRVKGFEFGADDYLIKPFAFSELLARVRSLVRRRQPHAASVLEIADLVIDVQKHKVSRNKTDVRLTAKEFMLLNFMANRIGEVLSRTLIAEQVWDINFDSDTKAIDVAIKRLRDKVDKDFDVKLIHNVRGVGYVFEIR